MSVAMWLEIVMVVLVGAAAVWDLATRRIPNRLLLLAWMLALPLHAAAPAPFAALGGCLAGALVGLGMFLPFYLLRGMAAGDVKLMATVGAVAGPEPAFAIALLSWCAGGLMAVAMIVVQGRVRAAWDNLRALLRPLLMRLAGIPAVAEPLAHPSVGTMPYGLAVALGTLYTVWLRHG
jgi:prepilin peptidase CpaA